MWLRYRVFSNASPFFFGLENKPQSYLGWDLTLKGLLRRGLGTADLGKQSQSPGPVDRLSVPRIALQHGSFSFRAASMHCPSTPLSHVVFRQCHDIASRCYTSRRKAYVIRVMEAPRLAAVRTNTLSWRRARLRQIWFGGSVCVSK